MHSVFTLLFFAALLAIVFAWANGFRFRDVARENRRSRKGAYQRLRDLPLFARVRLGFAILIAGLQPHAKGAQLLANFNSSEHLEGRVTYIADNDFTDAGQQAGRFLVAKIGSDAAHIDLCGATDEPLGICTDSPKAGDTNGGSVNVFGAARGTQRGIAAVAITAGDDLYTAASGRITNVPVNGCYHIGRAIQAATGAGDDFEFTAIKPVLVVKVVLTATGTANAVDLATTEALANAIKVDLAAIKAACTKPALILLA